MPSSKKARGIHKNIRNGETWGKQGCHVRELLSNNGSRLQILSAYGAHITTNENNTSSMLMYTLQAGMLWKGTGLKG